MRIAIIGSGISGLTSAYLLSFEHDVEVFEQDVRIGGHTATIDVNFQGDKQKVDTGFIVYNERTYPNFVKLLAKLEVETKVSSMGFSVSCAQTGLEYAGNSLNSLFAQRSNLFSPPFLAMLRDILRFNKKAVQDFDSGNIDDQVTLGEYLSKHNFSDAFCRYYLMPMAAAIWSASFTQVKQFPLIFFIRFFRNHGLLSVFDKPQWRVIKGGSRSYLDPLTAPYRDKIHCGVHINRVVRKPSSVDIFFGSGEVETFDRVVIATHSDQALSMLSDPSSAESDILASIPYQENSVVLHTDTSVLPGNRKTWSSWNYHLGENHHALPRLTYNMNLLQGLASPHTYNVTLNADDAIDKTKIIDRFSYAHPQFDLKSYAAQQRWCEINGVNRTWFCGAYWGNGFHEDGVNSALAVVSDMGVEAPL